MNWSEPQIEPRLVLSVGQMDVAACHRAALHRVQQRLPYAALLHAWNELEQLISQKIGDGVSEPRPVCESDASHPIQQHDGVRCAMDERIPLLQGLLKAA